MADHRLSTTSLVSQLEDELDQIQLLDNFELTDIHRLPRTENGEETEEQRLLDVPAQVHVSETSDDTSKQPSAFTRALRYRDGFKRNHSYDPAISEGIEKLKKTIKRSGPISRTNTTLEGGSKPKKKGIFGFEGWRFGILMSLFTVGACLLVELVMLICALTLQDPAKFQDGIGVLYTGDCARAQRITTLLAIPLNIIATLLVSTSNYVMQCLSAPTRTEIDESHANGRYLNIGISSVYNVFFNYSRKSLLWLTLVLTTIPIHLLLNSAFFNSLQANNYGVMIVSQGWLEDDSWNGCDVSLDSPLDLDYLGESTMGSHFACDMRSLASIGDFNDNAITVQPLPLEHLTRDECFARYSTDLQSTASNVVLVSTTTRGKYANVPISMGHETNLSIIEATGNAVPVLDNRQHWQFPRAPQNTSGTIFLQPNDSIWEVPTFRSAFSSFDYRYWVMAGQVDYNFNDSRVSGALQWNPTSWMCPTSAIMSGEVLTISSKGCTTSGSKSDSANWLVTPEEFEVDHCLSQPTAEQCSLEYSFTILLIIIACDVLKLAAMGMAIWWLPESPLATIGDAIASFLERPDPFTAEQCLLDQDSVRRDGYLNVNLQKAPTSSATQPSPLKPVAPPSPSHRATVWIPRVVRWHSVPSRLRRASFVFLYAALFIASIIVLAYGIRNLSSLGISDPWNQGFGSVNPNAIFSYPASFQTLLSPGNVTTYNTVQTDKARTLFADVITVNTPQLLFSTLYFMYNGMFTSMVTAAEWTHFAKVRKALRVSKPAKGQRSTYWLQLPWKYSVPLLSMSILLHWLVSRSLFIVRISVFGWDGNAQPDRNISACGYSPLAILIVLMVLVLSLIVLAWAGMQKLTPGIPVAGTCSLAISAACHYSEEGDLDVARKPLMWGVVRRADKDSDGHCSMSSEEVEEPISGCSYA